MNFIFKRRPIVVDFFTSAVHAYEYFPINYTKKFYPDWWKKLPNSIVEPSSIGELTSTLKTCPGMTDFFGNGITVPLWSDVYLRIGDKQSKRVNWQFSDRQSNFDFHPAEQRGEWLPNEYYQHLKLVVPWYGVCKEPVQFAYVPNTWAFDRPEKLVIVPGVTDFKYQIGLHMNMFVPYGDIEDGVMLKNGTPLFNLMPLSDRELKFKCHLVSDDELRKLREKYGAAAFTFKGMHRKIKRFIDQKEKKCPFGF